MLSNTILELFILATSPALQRTGAGTALINWGIERAENEAVDVRLDATKGSFGSSSA